MDKSKKTGKGEQLFTRTIRDDLKNIKIKNDLGSEYKSLKEYYLTEERKKKLETMGSFKKFFIIPWWLLKALFFKLTPFRRILLVIAIILILVSNRSGVSSEQVTIELFGPAFIAGLILLFILALELKDKLVARTELEEGRAVQKALMPEQNPKVDGWDIWLYTQSANDVGGDLLDFIKLDENKFGISVGDVAGKGLSAALLMAKLQATIRAIVQDYSSLSDFAKKLNEIFLRDSIPKFFASLLYVELQSNSSELRFINAGHLPPLKIKGTNIRQLIKDSPALGLVKHTNFSEHNISLDDNEVLIIYSDGLTEAQNENGDFYGEARLASLLQNTVKEGSRFIGEKIIKSIFDFAGSALMHDDLTIAILRKVKN